MKLETKCPRYYVPRDGDATSKQRDFVWIWYDNIAIGSQQLHETLTDVSGKTHQTTVPRGKMNPQIWQRVIDRESSVGNPYFVDVMRAVKEPFVSTINDFGGQKSVFWNGRVLLVGDAFTLCRPHGGGSTSQAALQAQTLLQALQGEMTLEQWEQSCLAAAQKAAQFSLAMADFLWNGKVSKSPGETTKSKPASGGDTS
jgi:2-polyprenyl-6-methoxyphenol hydroxylase-like FAD-dependent oxidoreductase